MSSTNVLLVDSDAKSQRVLEVSLRKAGFSVLTAPDLEPALDLALERAPEIVITEADLPNGTGFDLCRLLREDPRTTGTGVMFLAADGTPEAKIRAISAGADDYLAKPLFVKEIVARIRALVERRQNEAFSRRERPANFSGTLAGMGLVDLFQLIEIGKKTCILHLTSDRQRSGGFVAEGEEHARIYFRDGKVIDAETKQRRAEAAVYRLLLWDDGAFEIEFTPVARDAVITTPTQGVLLEGMRRVDEWSRLSASLPSLAARLDVDFTELSERSIGMPAEVDSLIRLFDGRRTVLGVIDESSLDDLAALSIIARLVTEGILSDHRARTSTDLSSKELSLDAWLSTQPRRASMMPKPAPAEDSLLEALPSELGHAMIPSPDTASQILAAIDPRYSSATQLPEPLAEDGSVLARRTIPAAVSGASGTPGGASVPPAPTGDRLTLRRMGSSVAPPPVAITPAAPVVAPLTSAPPRASSAVFTAPPSSASVSLAPFSRAPAAAATPAISAAEANTAAEPDTEADSGAEDEAGGRLRRGLRTPTYRATRRPTTARTSQPPSIGPIPAASPPVPPAPGPVPHAAASAPHAPASTPHAAASTPHAPASTPHAPAPAPHAPAPAAPLAVPPRPAAFAEPSPLPQIARPPRPETPAPLAPRAPAGTHRIPQEDLDAEFARLRNVDTDDFTEPKSWVTWALGLGIIAALAAWAVFLFTKNDRPSIEPAITAAPSGPPRVPTVIIPPEGPEVQAVASATAASATVAAAPIVLPAADPGPSAEVVAMINEELAAGEEALTKEKYGAARAAFEKVLGADEQNADARAGLAHALYGLRNDAAALSEAKKALEEEPDVARAHLVLAFIAGDRGKTGEAVSEYKRYLELEPDSPFAGEIRQFLASQK
ncbi:MAG: DUF4388 domain-containing protein [Deltaproteobacteria bacterium]|nr:DUF4388 domain-containing protein [Deltaproteobacteria bacterium]